MKPCIKNVAEQSELSEAQAAALLQKHAKKAKQRSEFEGITIEEAIQKIGKELQAENEFLSKIRQRSILLNLKARRNIKSFVKNFPSMGEGLVAYLEGSSKTLGASRLSVDAQSKSLHGKYIGRLTAELEQAGLLREFKSGDLTREIYMEMGELNKEDGKPGISGSKRAQAIANIIEGITSEMVARQNRAGAYIAKMPGYVARQTHDMDQIRRAGGPGMSPKQKEESFKVWSEFVMPLIDPERTFEGADPKEFLKNVHDALYSGVHGPTKGEWDKTPVGIAGSLARKVSRERVIHFKDALSAYEYNQKFGMRALKDQVLSDIYTRARSIAMMENFGPDVDANFAKLLSELSFEARDKSNAKDIDSLKDWKIQAAFDIVSGKADMPQDHTLAKNMSIFRSLATVTKLGGTLLSALSDKSFMSAELAYQGMGTLDRWAGQLKALAPKSGDEKQMFRAMGVALDGIMGHTASRYTFHGQTIPGVAKKINDAFFNLNFMNWWTDNHKGAAAMLMTHHLGEHSDMAFDKLPGELSRVLSLYGITPQRWDALRSTAWAKEGGDAKFITPDKVSQIPDETLAKLVEERGLSANDTNVARERDYLETQLRSYIHDRVDIAIPTPGAAERRISTWGALRPGTPFGEAARLIMMFKEFPLTIMQKVIGREIYGRGAMSMKQWLLNDHAGKFHMATMIASTIAAGYMSGALKDLLKGRTPKRLIDEDGFHADVLTDAALRGGGIGLMGDVLFSDYERSYRSFSSYVAGPMIGQLDPLAEIFTTLKHGDVDSAIQKTGKFAISNIPFANLFYIRPVLDYFVFWNLNEMLTPGYASNLERNVEDKNHQGFLIRPTDIVK